jgi:hypothetical protein
MVEAQVVGLMKMPVGFVNMCNRFFLVVPLGLDEAAIQAADLMVKRCEDRTDASAQIAAGLYAARVRRAAELEREEGADWFGQRQRFLETAAELAESRRLSRFLFAARKSAEPPNAD